MKKRIRRLHHWDFNSLKRSYCSDPGSPFLRTLVELNPRFITLANKTFLAWLWPALGAHVLLSNLRLTSD